MLTTFLAPDLFPVTLLTSGDADDVDQAVIVPDVGSVGRLVAVADGGPGTFLPGDRKRLQTVVAGGDLAHHLRPTFSR